MADKILRNKVKCKKCGDEIESVVANKDVKCKCGQTSISGGTQALIRECTKDTYLELSELLLNE